LETPPPSNRTRAAARGYRPPHAKPSRRPADEREDSFNALAWIVEGATGFIEEMRRNDLGLSEEFWVHAAAARRESLLAARALLDQWLEETQKQQTTQRTREERQARRGGINVDF
jgi:sarcosine oxidase delta subunit